MRLSSIGRKLAAGAAAFCLVAGMEVATASGTSNAKNTAIQSLSMGNAAELASSQSATGARGGYSGPHLGGIMCLDVVPYDYHPYGYAMWGWNGHSWDFWWWSGWRTTAYGGDVTFLRVNAPNTCVILGGYGWSQQYNRSYDRNGAYGCYGNGWTWQGVG